MVLALLSNLTAGSLNSGGKVMYFVSNVVMILAVAFLSFEFSLLLSRGLLLLVLHSMQRMESRVKGE